MSNPYKPGDEARYMTWEHGFNSNSETECPYDPEDKDTRELRGIWLKAFKANPAHKKKAVAESAEDAIEEQFPTSSGNSLDVKGLPTEMLELELKRRKLGDLQALHKSREELNKKLDLVNVKIQRLEVLLGE